MKQISVKQARELLALNEPIYLAVGNEIQEITRDNLLTTNDKGDKAYMLFNRDTIKELIQQVMGIDTFSWKYFCNDRGDVLLAC